MTDELYDYFGGNASKKVEPIEDDDLDNLDEEVESNQSADGTDELTTEASSQPDPSLKLASKLDPAPANEAEEIVADEPAAEKETKKGGHWDFLANMLGISPSKSEPKTPAKDSTSGRKVAKTASRSKIAAKKERAAEAPQAVTRDEESKSAAVSDQPDFFGLEPIPAEEDSTVLPEMFVASETDTTAEFIDDDPNALIGWDPIPPKSDSPDREQDSDEGSETIQEEPMAEVEEPVNYVEEDFIEGGDDDENFVEFEIEDLDDTPLDEDRERAHGRTSRRRKPSVEESNVEPTSRRRPRQTRNRTEETREVSTADESSSESKSETSRPSRSRGSRGGRERGDRSKSGDSSKRHTKKRDDFVPEDLEPIDLPPFAEGLDDIDVESESVDLKRPNPERSEAPRTGRKRRRRRGSKGRSEKSESEQSRVKDDEIEADIDNDDNFELDDNDAAAYDNSYRDESTSSESDDLDRDRSEDRDADRDTERGRGRARGRKSEEADSRTENSDANLTDERKRAKVPTWDEAISVLIDSNIENHKRTGGGQPRRGGNRGGGNRGGGNRGDGNRGDGNRGDGNRGDGNRGQSRGRRR